jgi:hypothetical protein
MITSQLLVRTTHFMGVPACPLKWMICIQKPACRTSEQVWIEIHELKNKRDYSCNEKLILDLTHHAALQQSKSTLAIMKIIWSLDSGLFQSVMIQRKTGGTCSLFLMFASRRESEKRKGLNSNLGYSRLQVVESEVRNIHEMKKIMSKRVEDPQEPRTWVKSIQKPVWKVFVLNKVHWKLGTLLT